MGKTNEENRQLSFLSDEAADIFRLCGLQPFAVSSTLNRQLGHTASRVAVQEAPIEKAKDCTAEPYSLVADSQCSDSTYTPAASVVECSDLQTSIPDAGIDFDLDPVEELVVRPPPGWLSSRATHDSVTGDRAGAPTAIVTCDKAASLRLFHTYHPVLLRQASRGRFGSDPLTLCLKRIWGL